MTGIDTQGHDVDREHGGDTKSETAPPPDDHVVLLDAVGMPIGSAVKRDIHHANTPFHLAVSCYVVRDDGAVLLTRRAPRKTFPGLWTNACCGHPRPGEELYQAVLRHLQHELGAEPLRLRLAIPDFTYRAVADNGVVEHELCPVFIAEVDDTPLSINPFEADDFEWVTWSNLVRRAEDEPGSLSPWCVPQISRLAGLFDEPVLWVRNKPTTTKFGRSTGDGRPDPFGRMSTDVDVVIEEFLGHADIDLGILDPLTTELAEPIAQLYRAGGKRLRPCLVYCGHAAADSPSSTDRRNVAHLAAAVEILHTFALLHDDVMDRSQLRRGLPTAHAWFARLHERNSERPSSSDGGANGLETQQRSSQETWRSCERTSCSTASTSMTPHSATSAVSSTCSDVR